MNAFNLMDNLDGAAGTVGGGLGRRAWAARGQPGRDRRSPRWRSRSPAPAPASSASTSPPAHGLPGRRRQHADGLRARRRRDGGPADGRLRDGRVFAVVPLVGLAVLDTTLVVFSRLRRGWACSPAAATTSRTACWSCSAPRRRSRSCSRARRRPVRGRLPALRLDDRHRVQRGDRLRAAGRRRSRRSSGRTCAPRPGRRRSCASPAPRRHSRIRLLTAATAIIERPVGAVSPHLRRSGSCA